MVRATRSEISEHFEEFRNLESNSDKVFDFALCIGPKKNAISGLEDTIKEVSPKNYKF